MTQVTISKKEYAQLKKQSRAYKSKAVNFFTAIIRSPIEEVVDDFRRTGLYEDKFLIDLEKGLKKSSYAK